MIRGTTATFKFKMPHQLQYIDQVKVTFWQNGHYGIAGSELPKSKIYTPKTTCESLPENDPYHTSTDLIVVLSGSETKAFTDKLKARVQIKASNIAYTNENGVTIAASTFGSRPQLFTVYPMEDGIIDGVYDEDMPTENNGYIILSGGNIVSVTEDGEG